MQSVMDTIESQLTSANQRPPEPGVIKAWTRDLQHRLGAVSPERLREAFILARDEASIRRGRGAFGQLALDDVIRHYRTVPATVEAVPVDPHCPHFCDRGKVMMIDSKAPAYDVLVPCSCRAGEHLRARLKIFDGKRNADELLRSGWSMKPQPRRLSQDETQWLMARSFETSIAHALWEKRKGREMPASEENLGRAAKILSGSSGRG